MKTLFIAAILLMAANAHAVEALFGATGNPRCGLGSMIWGSGQTISTQGSEMGTNALLMNESFSMTTGTSGCQHSGIAQIPPDAVIYANANYEELSVEMASGRGEALTGLGETFGCGGAEMPLFMKVGKDKYGEIFPASKTDPTQMIINFHQRLRQVPQLMHGCRLLTT